MVADLPLQSLRPQMERGRREGRSAAVDGRGSRDSSKKAGGALQLTSGFSCVRTLPHGGASPRHLG